MDRITFTDDIETHESQDSFSMTSEEAEQLYAFLEHEYISHEFYPLVHEMIKRLRIYIDE